MATACFGGLFSLISVLIFFLRASLLALLTNGMAQTPKKRIHAAKDMSCVICNTLVKSIPFYRQSTFKCCSRKCTREYQARLNNRIKTCVVCSAEFTVTTTRSDTAKYCSNLCKGRAMKGRGSVEHECLHCHAKFFDSPSKNRKYCSRTCINKASKTTWKPTFTTVRKKMLQREMLKSCERCGYDAQPSILGVHHKDRNTGNNCLSNLEVLCPNCHSLEHMKHTPHGFKE